MKSILRGQAWGYTLLAGVIIGGALLFIAFMAQIPQPLIEGRVMAIDWNLIHWALENGEIKYEGGLVLMNPPWTAVMVLPFGFIPMRTGWALMGYLTLIVLALSVPRSRPRGLYYAAVILLTASFPSLRNVADGNFEALVIGGICLCLWAYPRQQPWWMALGVLLASSKPQLASLFLLTLGVYMLQTWSRTQWLKTLLVVAVVTIPTFLWRGGDWLHNISINPTIGSLMDVSLRAAFNRADIASVVYGAIWLAMIAVTVWLLWRSERAFTREKAGLLVAASLLLAPYAAGNSLLTVLAIGIMPLFLKRPLLGLLLFIPTNLTFLFGRDTQAYFITALALAMWAGLAWQVWMTGKRTIGESTSVAAADTQNAFAIDNRV
jgi:hypothetical protein